MKWLKDIRSGIEFLTKYGAFIMLVLSILSFASTKIEEFEKTGKVPETKPEVSE